MDEDQVNQEQESNPERQEVTFSQASDQQSGGMFSRVARRDPVNLFSFFGKQNDNVNERISGLQTQIATLNNNLKLQSTNFENNLATIKNSILTLDQGLKVVAEKLELSQQLEKIRDANEKAREQQLAEQQLREGKESLIEKKIQTALAAPLQKIGAKAQTVLGGILKFFNTILLGIIGTRGIQVLGALISGNKEKLEEIKKKILKELGIATGIFVAINGGLAIALRSIIRLTGFVGRVAFTNLLARPIRRIFELARSGAITQAANRGSNIPPTQTRNQRNQRNQRRNQNRNRNRASNIGFLLPAPIAGTLEGVDRLASGQGIESALIGGTITGGGVFGTNRLLSSRFFRRLIPRRFRTLAEIATSVGGFALSSNIADQIIDARGSGNQIDQLGNLTQERQLQLREKNSNVIVIDDDEQTNVNAGQIGVGDASALLNVPSFNEDNPYILNSRIQYNMVL